MIQTATSPIAIPADVLAFAAAQGVSAELPALVDLAQRVFPGAPISVFLENDPEIADDWHIVIALNPVNLTVTEAMTARRQWLSGLFACCPAPKVCVFRLGLEGIRDDHGA